MKINILTRTIVVLSLLFPLVSYSDEQSTYHALLEARNCTISEFDQTQLDCVYNLDKSFHLVIAGVGKHDASIVFYKSDFYGKFYGKVGIMHGCVIITKSFDFFNIGFVSPKNGKVYQTWQACKQTNNS